jgi:hypothetical protein
MLEPSNPACETPQVTPGGRPLPAPRTDGRLLAQCCCARKQQRTRSKSPSSSGSAWSNDPQGRLNKEIRRRTDVVGIVLCEQHAEWAVGRRYMSADSLAKARLEVIQAEPIVEVRGELVAAS